MGEPRTLLKTSCFLPRARWFLRIPENAQPIVAFLFSLAAVLLAGALILGTTFVLYALGSLWALTPLLIVALLTFITAGAAEYVCKAGFARFEFDDDRVVFSGGARERVVIPREELVGVVTLNGFLKPLGAILVCKRRHVRLCGEWDHNTHAAMNELARWSGADHVVTHGLESWRILLKRASPKSAMPDFYCRNCGYFVGTLGDEVVCPECAAPFRLR